MAVALARGPLALFRDALNSLPVDLEKVLPCRFVHAYVDAFCLLCYLWQSGALCGGLLFVGTLVGAPDVIHPLHVTST